VFVPFTNGKAGKPEDFLTGFLTGNDNEVYGRPVGVAFAKDGAMLVADDASNTIWRVAPVK
jgi:glucose/arabinose dehydrogenase